MNDSDQAESDDLHDTMDAITVLAAELRRLVDQKQWRAGVLRAGNTAGPAPVVRLRSNQAPS